MTPEGTKVSFSLFMRDEGGARKYVMGFWDGDKWIEIDLTPLSKAVYDADAGTERGIESDGN